MYLVTVCACHIEIKGYLLTYYTAMQNAACLQEDRIQCSLTAVVDQGFLKDERIKEAQTSPTRTLSSFAYLAFSVAINFVRIVKFHAFCVDKGSCDLPYPRTRPCPTRADSAIKWRLRTTALLPVGLWLFSYASSTLQSCIAVLMLRISQDRHA